MWDKKMVKEGYTESAWVSLAVKSIRIGWPAGLEKAASMLPKSRFVGTVYCQLFEDIFPTEQSMEEILDIIEKRKWSLLCEYDTHHGRGYTAAFCDLEKEAVGAARDQEKVEKMRAECLERYGFYLTPRMANVYYTWRKIHPTREGWRTVDKREYIGMPAVVLDCHTYEGKRAGKDCLLASGHYHQHKKISEMVLRDGWDKFRELFHTDILKREDPVLL